MSRRKEEEAIQSIHFAGVTLLELINDVLDLSKLEAGQMKITPEKLDLRNLLNDLRKLFARKLDEKGLTGRIAVPADLPDALPRSAAAAPDSVQPARQCREVHTPRRHSADSGIPSPGRNGRRPDDPRRGHRRRHRAGIYDAHFRAVRPAGCPAGAYRPGNRAGTPDLQASGRTDERHAVGNKRAGERELLYRVSSGRAV